MPTGRSLNRFAGQGVFSLVWICAVLSKRVPLPRRLSKDELRFLNEMLIFRYTLEELEPGFFAIRRWHTGDSMTAASEWFGFADEDGHVSFEDALHLLRQLSIHNGHIYGRDEVSIRLRLRKFRTLLQFLKGRTTSRAPFAAFNGIPDSAKIVQRFLYRRSSEDRLRFHRWRNKG